MRTAAINKLANVFMMFFVFVIYTMMVEGFIVPYTLHESFLKKVRFELKLGGYFSPSDLSFFRMSAFNSSHSASLVDDLQFSFKALSITTC